MSGAANHGLLARLRAARERTVEFAPGKVLRYLRPTEVQILDMRRGQLDPLQLVMDHAVGWSGLTEADLLGQAVGSSDPVQWDADVAREVLADHAEWLSASAAAIQQAAVDHINERAAASGN